MRFRISFTEWRTWVGVALVGIGTSLFLLPVQDWINTQMASVFTAPWQIMLTGGAITAAAMYFFRTG